MPQTARAETANPFYGLGNDVEIGGERPGMLQARSLRKNLEAIAADIHARMAQILFAAR